MVARTAFVRRPGAADARGPVQRSFSTDGETTARSTGRAQLDRREAFSDSLRRSRRDEFGMRMGGGSDAYGETYGCVHYVEWIVGLRNT